MLTLPFKWKNSRGNEPVKCNNNVFGDPLPGTPKACFCDDIHKMSHNQITSFQEFNLATANAVLAEESSKNLEKQAKEQEAEIEKQRKKHMEDMEKQSKKNKAALDALLAADKAQAEKEKTASLALEKREKELAKQLDKEMHDNEKSDLEAKKAAEKQALEYAVAMKAAHDASELDRMKLQLEASKKKAEMEKLQATADQAAAQFAKAQQLMDQQKIAAELRAQQVQTDIDMRAAALAQK